MITVKVEGFAELERALRQLPEEIAGKVLREAFRRASKPMAEDAKQSAPRSDDPGAGGHMADSIKVRNMKSENSLNDVQVDFWIGPDRKHFYGLFQEFGTVKQGARPFMRPAFDSDVQGVIDRFGGEIWKGIERAARKLNR